MLHPIATDNHYGLVYTHTHTCTLKFAYTFILLGTGIIGIGENGITETFGNSRELE